MTQSETGELTQVKAFGRQINISRVLGCYGSGSGPTIVVIAGLHGNEPAGVVAFLELIERLRASKAQGKGRIIGLAGNLAALRLGVRYIDADLNRLWRTETIRQISEQPDGMSDPTCSEYSELRELYTHIKRILKEEQGPFYFIDLHTTSSISPPFIPFDDTLTNREFVRNFPVPCILGIEEFLPGTLLSYLVRYRVVTFGFEAGRHDDPNSVDYHRAMLLLAMQKTGMLPKSEFSAASDCEHILSERSQGTKGFYEIRYRYLIQPEERFQMLPGFASFHPVRKRQQVASNRYGSIHTEQGGQIFMPLYQAQGDDGFFLIRRVPRVWLELSKKLRSWRLERVLSKLPGVKALDQDSSTLAVNPHTARFLSRQILHLLGYRRTDSNGTQIKFSRRDH